MAFGRLSRAEAANVRQMSYVPDAGHTMLINLFLAARASGFGGQDFSAMADALCQAAGIEKPRLKS